MEKSIIAYRCHSLILHTPCGTLWLEYTSPTTMLEELAHRRIQLKQVVHHANDANLKWHLYQNYMSHRPPEATSNAFYLTHLKKPRGNLWYGNIPIGLNKLDTTVSRNCKAAGIAGCKTNHSLRVTTATCLFQKGMEEQLIMSWTGHRSVEGVWTYKRIVRRTEANVVGPS